MKEKQDQNFNSLKKLSRDEMRNIFAGEVICAAFCLVAPGGHSGWCLPKWEGLEEACYCFDGASNSWSQNRCNA